MACGIYKIINTVNNKFYVGSAIDFTARKRRHWWGLRNNRHANKHLQAAWNKYGETAFAFIVVSELSKEDDILAAENVWLKEHVGKEYCYNLGTDATAPTRGWYGEKNSMWGKTFTHTDDAKAKISIASKARIQSEEEKAKRRKTMKGHFVAPSTRAKISEALSGEKNFNYGKPRSQTFKDKVSKIVVAIAPNGEKYVYYSITALREAMDIKPPTINRALKSGNAILRGPYVGWSFKYK
jgi:group I intron endonuclease